MKTVNTMEAIRDFILGCPYLKDGYLQVDFLGDKPVEYTLDTSPEGGALRRYADGSSLCEFVFVFASREHYGADVAAALENCGFTNGSPRGWTNRQGAVICPCWAKDGARKRSRRSTRAASRTPIWAARAMKSNAGWFIKSYLKFKEDF